MSELKPCNSGETDLLHCHSCGSPAEIFYEADQEFARCTDDYCFMGRIGAPTSDWNTRAAPKVKPLEFADSKAEGCNIIYNIKKWPNSKKYRVMFNRFGGIDWLMDKFDSWHDARVAAQSHYEKLILEALE